MIMSVDLPRPKKEGEHQDVLLCDGLPSETLHKFRREIRNKPSDNDRVAELTADAYVRSIRLWIDYLADRRGKRPLEADTSDLREFLKHCRANDETDNTLTKRRSAVSRFYDELGLLAEDKQFSIDPADVPENPEDDHRASWSVGESEKSKQSGENLQYLKPAQVNALWSNVSAPTLRNRLIIRLLYSTGMRVSELTHIEKKNIRREEREIDIPAAKSKSSSRTVAYKESVRQDLREWIDGGHRDAEYYASEENDYLFPTRRAEHISRSTVLRIVKEAAENAGLDNSSIYTTARGHDLHKISPHILRHSMAVNSLEAGVLNVRELQEILGHGSLDTTEKYLKIASDDATDKYHERGGPPES